MCILTSIVAAVVLVFLGYIALWTAGRTSTSTGVAKFGRIMAIILFVFAGLVVVMHVSRPHFRGHGMMGRMGEMREKYMPFMHGHKGWWHKENMKEMAPGCEKGQMEEKGQLGVPATTPQVQKNK